MQSNRMSNSKTKWILMYQLIIILHLLISPAQANQYCQVDKCKICPDEHVYVCRECESGYYLRTFHSNERGANYNDCWSIWKLIFSILGILLATLLTCALCFLCFKIGKDSKLKNKELQILRQKEKERIEREKEEAVKRSKRMDTERYLNMSTERSVTPNRSYRSNYGNLNLINKKKEEEKKKKTTPKKTKVKMVEKSTDVDPKLSQIEPAKEEPQRKEVKISTVIHHQHHPSNSYLSPRNVRTEQQFLSQPPQAVYNSPETTFFQNNPPHNNANTSQIISPRNIIHTQNEYTTPIRTYQPNVRVISQNNQSQPLFNRPVYTHFKPQENPLIEEQVVNFHTPQHQYSRSIIQQQPQQQYDNRPLRVIRNSYVIKKPGNLLPQRKDFNNYNYEKENNNGEDNIRYEYEPTEEEFPEILHKKKDDFRNKRSNTPVQIRKTFRDPEDPPSVTSPIRPILQPQNYATKNPITNKGIARRSTYEPQNENPPHNGVRREEREGYFSPRTRRGRNEDHSPYLANPEDIVTTQRGTVEKKISSPRIEQVTVQEQISPEQVVNVVKPMLVQDTYIVEERKMIIKPNNGGKPKAVNRRTVTSHQDIMDFDDLDSIENNRGEWN